MSRGRERSAYMIKTAQERRRTEEWQVLLSSLERTRRELVLARAGFDGASDPELTESFNYEMLALQARYGYLLRQIKILDGMGQQTDTEGPSLGHLPQTACP